MGRSQRNKGAGYEREVGQQLSAALGVSCMRKLGQARDSGNDIDAGRLVVECKRRKTLTTISSWLRQAMAAVDTQAEKEDRQFLYPVVVAREDGGESMVILWLDDFLELAGPELRRGIAEDVLITAAG